MTTDTPTHTVGSARRAFDRLTTDSQHLYAQHVTHTTFEGHARFSVSYLHAPDGALQIEWCDDCSYLRVFCEHEHCSWNNRTVLTCDLCGEDLT